MNESDLSIEDRLGIIGLANDLVGKGYSLNDIVLRASQKIDKKLSEGDLIWIYYAVTGGGDLLNEIKFAQQIDKRPDIYIKNATEKIRSNPNWIKGRLAVDKYSKYQTEKEFIEDYAIKRIAKISF